MSEAFDKSLLIAEKEPSLKTEENSLSIIIPVYNEEKGIENVVEKLKRILLSSNINYEIIIVDDCSTDRSAEIIGRIEGVRFFKHSKNIGYGGALKTGLKRANGNIIAITDGDGTYPNEMIPEMIKFIDEYDMVVGARTMSSKNIALSRKPVKWVLGKLANYLSETKIPDLNSGLRIFKKNVAMKFYQMYPSGFSFTTTITLSMHCKGYDVKYIPIEYGKREGKSKISPIKDTLNFVQLIWRTVMYFNPLKIFLPISLIMFLGFAISLLYDIIFLHNLTDKTIISFLAFIQIVMVGLLADLIDKRNPFSS